MYPRIASAFAIMLAVAFAWPNGVLAQGARESCEVLRGAMATAATEAEAAARRVASAVERGDHHAASEALLEAEQAATDARRTYNYVGKCDPPFDKDQEYRARAQAAAKRAKDTIEPLERAAAERERERERAVLNDPAREAARAQGEAAAERIEQIAVLAAREWRNAFRALIDAENADSNTYLAAHEREEETRAFAERTERAAEYTQRFVEELRWRMSLPGFTADDIEEYVADIVRSLATLEDALARIEE